MITAPNDTTGSTNTEDINNAGESTGEFHDGVTNTNRMFVRSATGQFTVFDPPNSLGLEARGLNDGGDVTGGFADTSTGNTVRGYVRTADGQFALFDAPNAVTTVLLDGGTEPRAINNAGQVTGWFADSVTGTQRGFVRDAPAVSDDVVADFGSSFGVWGLYNNGPSAPLDAGPLESTLTVIGSAELARAPLFAQIHALSPEEMATGDVDGSGQADLILDFPGAGVWILLDNTSWIQLHTANVTAITTGDIDGNGQSEVILDFPAFGTWIHLNNSSWVQLHPLSPTQLTTGDLDADGKSEVIIDFAGLGVWAWLNNTSWGPVAPVERGRDGGWGSRRGRPNGRRARFPGIWPLGLVQQHHLVGAPFPEPEQCHHR